MFWILQDAEELFLDAPPALLPARLLQENAERERGRGGGRSLP